VEGAAVTKEWADPFERFGAVSAEARQADPAGWDAMCVSTIGADGRPHGRFVLLKGFDRDGFVFYTNLDSRKSAELRANPVAAITFYWPAIQQQIRIEGAVTAVTDAEADAYFASRPRGSQIGAWASKQSAPLDDRQTLEDRVAEFERKFEGAPVPRPPNWSGWRVTPDLVEFWIGQPSRLHDRFRYRRSGSAWSCERLYP
jgi:pyridoxamine 5'-phosphate oxidase